MSPLLHALLHPATAILVHPCTLPVRFCAGTHLCRGCRSIRAWSTTSDNIKYYQILTALLRGQLIFLGLTWVNQLGAKKMCALLIWPLICMA